MRTYYGAHKDTTLQNLEQYATYLSKLQERTKSSSTGGNNHGGSRGRHKQIIVFRRTENVALVMSIEQHRGSASSSSSSGEESERFERRKPWKSSWSGRQISLLDVAPVKTQTLQTTQYSNFAPLRSSTAGYCRFCFDSSNSSQLWCIVPSVIWLVLLHKGD